MADHLLMPAAPGFLILPPSVARNREQGVAVNKCLSCGAEFALDQPEKFGRHVRHCSEVHAPEQEAVVARHQANELANPSDPELYQWIREGKS
jgi:hypothetical protein